MQYWVILGAGITGMSVARYCYRHGIAFYVMDVATHLPLQAELEKYCPPENIILGGFDRSLIAGAAQCVFSPGIDPNQELFADAQVKTNDIALFACQANAPLIAITGTNGKSTVASLLHAALESTGKRCLLGGNIGIPVLDLLHEAVPDYYVLELSSFQLELVDHLNALCAVVLNQTPDHLDRHRDFAQYCAIKNNIYRGCRYSIKQAPSREADCELVDGPPEAGQYGLIEHQHDIRLMKGDEPLLQLSELALLGRHNAYNVLAVIAICDRLAIDLTCYRQAICEFEGLAHRCRQIAQIDGVQWIDDSKATNVGACLAAIESVSPYVQGKMVLILGGRTKGEEYRRLLPVIRQLVSHVLLIGESRAEFRVILHGAVDQYVCLSMQDAVKQAQSLTQTGDCVLLSPACASFDWYTDYRQRGLSFKKEVMRLMNVK
jgi:UDP-N-acetylmuramoylalanine--D-glutamate ligase